MKAARTDTIPVAAGPSIAVFPVENLSGTTAPLRAIRDSLILDLKTKGFNVVDEDVLEKFMARNRVRYASGIDGSTALALNKETGAEAVLITSVELYSEIVPPRIALASRLVSAEETPAILWAEGVGMAGDDAPGILGLGLIEDPKLLTRKALEMLASSLEGYYHGKTEKRGAQELKKKFEPKIAFRASGLDGRKKYTIAIMPFFNQSDRKNAGEILVLHFIGGLKRFENFDVVEPGLVRKTFLTQRIIMQEGVSLPEANALFAALDADMILSGDVLDYQDTQAGYGKPKVNFSIQVIEKNTKKVVWSSISHNEGDDGVFFFDWGRFNTAHAMAAQMATMVGKAIEKR